MIDSENSFMFNPGGVGDLEWVPAQKDVDVFNAFNVFLREAGEDGEPAIFRSNLISKLNKEADPLKRSWIQEKLNEIDGKPLNQAIRKKWGILSAPARGEAIRY